MSNRMTRKSFVGLSQSCEESFNKNKIIKLEQTDGTPEAIANKSLGTDTEGSQNSDGTAEFSNSHDTHSTRADLNFDRIISKKSNAGEESENNNEILKFKIFQNITVKAPNVGDGNSLMSEQPRKPPNDISIYDYDEDGVTFPEIDTTDMDRKCKRCYKFFENPLDLLRHSRLCYVERKILPAEEVEKYFDSPNRNFCPICEKPIKTRNFKSVFVKHLLVHTTGLTHECTICKKKFKRRDHMRAHQKRHIVCC